MMTSGPQILTPAYYDRLYEIEQVHGWSRGMRALASVLLDPVSRKASSWTILDAGCGTGGTSEWLRRFPRVRVVGIDLSAEALDFCRRRGQCALALGSVAELPFADESFDLVVSTDVLQHVANPPGDAGALAESYRVLRPGGYLYLRTNSRFGLSAGNASATNYRRYSQPELVECVRAAGFQVELAIYANSLPSLLAIARARFRRRAAPNGGGDAGLRLKARPPSLRWIDRGLAFVLAVEARYVRFSGRGLPFGHSLVVLARRSVKG